MIPVRQKNIAGNSNLAFSSYIIRQKNIAGNSNLTFLHTVHVILQHATVQVHSTSICVVGVIRVQKFTVPGAGSVLATGAKRVHIFIKTL
jgi:hypothetical protein